jgi:hypothetical protein
MYHSIVGAVRQFFTPGTCEHCSRLLHQTKTKKEIQHWGSKDDLKDSSDSCWLCNFLWRSVQGTRGLVLNQDFWLDRAGQMSSEQQNKLKSTCVNVKVLESCPPFSTDMPFTWLQPSYGYAGNEHTGKTIGITQGSRQPILSLHIIPNKRQCLMITPNITGKEATKGKTKTKDSR